MCSVRRRRPIPLQNGTVCICMRTHTHTYTGELDSGKKRVGARRWGVIAEPADWIFMRLQSFRANDALSRNFHRGGLEITRERCLRVFVRERWEKKANMTEKVVCIYVALRRRARARVTAFYGPHHWCAIPTIAPDKRAWNSVVAARRKSVSALSFYVWILSFLCRGSQARLCVCESLCELSQKWINHEWIMNAFFMYKKVEGV